EAAGQALDSGNSEAVGWPETLAKVVDEQGFTTTNRACDTYPERLLARCVHDLTDLSVLQDKHCADVETRKSHLPGLAQGPTHPHCKTRLGPRARTGASPVPTMGGP